MKQHERKIGKPGGHKPQATETRKHQHLPKVEQRVEGLEGEVFNVKLDEEGNVSLEWIGEWEAGRIWGKVGGRVNFEGRALCGPLRVLAQQPEVTNDYSCEVRHPCEKQEECCARELLDELQVDQGVSWVQ